MHMELDCPGCRRSYPVPQDDPAAEALERMTHIGPWFAVGDGETFEDMLFAAVTAPGILHCPACGEPGTVTQESLNRIASQTLTQW
jgi:hypothetical protein